MLAKRRTRTKLLNSLPHDPLLTTAQLSLGYAFCDIAVSVLPLLTEVTNLNKKQMHRPMNKMFFHREPTQSVCVADCYFTVNVLDLPFASPIAIYR